MDIFGLREYILDAYGVGAEFPWFDDSESMVFRHPDNRKWFAVALKVARGKLGLEGEEKSYVVNFKCDPGLSLAVRDGKGIFPAYHMNKEKWISVLLDGSVGEDVVKMLLNESFCLTASQPKGKNAGLIDNPPV